MEEEKIIDQSVLAEDVASKVPYEFLDYFLVKPLDPIKVVKQFSKPVTTGTPVEDANGIKAEDFDSVETEVKEVNSDYRTGIVIKRPMYYNRSTDDTSVTEIKVGDKVVFRDAAGFNFDLLKDSRLLRQFDILGIAK